MKNKTVSIRIDDQLHQQASQLAKEQSITLTEFLRRAVECACIQPDDDVNAEEFNPYSDAFKKEVAWYREQLDQVAQERQQWSEERIRNQSILLANEAIIKSLTDLVESHRLQLAEAKRPRPILARLKAVFVTD